MKDINATHRLDIGLLFAIWMLIIAVLVFTLASPALAGILLGTEAYTGTVYEIDTETGFATALTETEEVGSSFSPNGNAWDATSQRFYYTTIPASGFSNLYFLTLSSSETVLSGQLLGRAPDAAFYDDAFYYIDSGTDNLRRVSIDAEGQIIQDSHIKNLVGGTYGWGFGDIEISDDGLLIVMGGQTDSSNNELFLYDLIADDIVSKFTVDRALQISFGSDGVLYGVSTNNKLYSIDLTSGLNTEIVDVTGNYYNITDLARSPYSSAVPLPGAFLLLGSGLLAGLWMFRNSSRQRLS